jgi:predicted solute-binding protein
MAVAEMLSESIQSSRTVANFAIRTSDSAGAADVSAYSRICSMRLFTRESLSAMRCASPKTSERSMVCVEIPVLSKSFSL